MTLKKYNIPFGTITITDKAKRLVNEALDQKRISSGKLVQEFENKFAALYGLREAVAVSTGTDANALALAVLYDYGASRGDEIIIPALSFIATGNAVLHAGFTPVFVDINQETLNIDHSLIEKTITPKTRAIMPVHLMGKPAAMDEINDIAKYHHIGIAEQNMVNVAAGLALAGKIVYMYSIAPFLPLRCYEQISVHLSFRDLHITGVVVGAGRPRG